MSTKMRLNNVRIAFPKLFHPEAFGGGEEKYSAVILIPKDHPQIKDLEKAILEEGKTKFAKQLAKDKWPSTLNNPLLDGDEKAEDYPAFEGCYRVNAKAHNKPLVISPSKERYEEDECPIASGSFVNVVISIAAYDNVAKGVGIYLSGVQFKKAGELIGGGASVDDFDEEVEEDDDYDF